MKTRKRLGVLLGLGGLVLAAAAVIGGLLIARNYVFLDGRPYSVQSETLDLSGMQNPELEKLTRFPQLKSVDLRDTHITLEEHSHLAAALPECSISWQVPFHGEYLELDTQSVSITTVLPEDAEALAQLPALETVDCTGCEDLEMLAQLRKGLPECEVLYTLCLDGQTLDQDTKELRLEHVDLPALRRALPCLPGVERLTAVDWTPEPESVDSLRKEFPGIGLFFEWDDRLLPLDEETTALDLNSWPLTAAAAEGLLGCFPKLEQAKMLDTGLTDEELFALCDAFPNCEFLWEAPFGPVRALTDVEEIDISDYPVEDPAWVESLLPYFPRLQKVVMCRCGLDNETMNALNRRHEDVNFVWEVSVGVVKVRTDTDYFAPGYHCGGRGPYGPEDLRLGEIHAQAAISDHCGQRHFGHFRPGGVQGAHLPGDVPDPCKGLQPAAELQKAGGPEYVLYLWRPGAHQQNDLAEAAVVDEDPLHLSGYGAVPAGYSGGAGLRLLHRLWLAGRRSLQGAAGYSGNVLSGGLRRCETGFHFFPAIKKTLIVFGTSVLDSLRKNGYNRLQKVTF